MDEKRKNSDWENYVQGESLAFLGSLKLVAGLTGCSIAYMSFNNVFNVNDFIKYPLIILSLFTALISFYSLFKEK